MKSGSNLIAEERLRQRESEGWSTYHDSQHDESELLFAAEAYMMRPFMEPEDLQKLWPFNEEYFKPTPHNRVVELIKAGALIAAEIDRLQHEMYLNLGETCLSKEDGKCCLSYGSCRQCL